MNGQLAYLAHKAASVYWMRLKVKDALWIMQAGGVRRVEPAGLHLDHHSNCSNGDAALVLICPEATGRNQTTRAAGRVVIGRRRITGNKQTLPHSFLHTNTRIGPRLKVFE